jgi:ABC-2 type transport system permease protein
VIAGPGSTLWLLGWEIRLSWRALIGNRRSVIRLLAFGFLGLVSLSIGFLIALPLRLVTIPINSTSVVIADAVAAFVFTLMLSQTLAGATDALYTRGDLDLLFSSPLSPRKTLTVRFLAMATTAYASFGLLVAPLLLPAALLGHPAWLALLVVLAALALGASATGLAVAVALFALIGPRRTKVVAQVMAALIGAAVFLTSQIHSLLGGRGFQTASQRMLDLAQHARFHYPPLSDLPLRAALGEPLPLLIFVVAGAGLFFGVSGWLSRRFAADASAAKGADVGAARTSRRTVVAFAAGAFAATFRKEVRLLRRDIALMSQVLLRVLYLLPTIFLVLRGAGGAQMLVLPFGVGLLTFMSGQVASSLTWITVSAEDAPELIAASPAAPTSLRSAKLAAGLAPLAVLLVIPLIVLTALAPTAGLAATLGCAAAAAAAGMINVWHPVPGKRSEFRRRRSGSVLLGLALAFDSLFIAVAAGLIAAGQLWGLIPAAIAALILALMRRSPAQIADALAASA